MEEDEWNSWQLLNYFRTKLKERTGLTKPSALFDIFMHLSRDVYIRRTINRWNRILQARSVVVKLFR